MTAAWMMNFFNIGATIGSLFIIWFVTWTFMARPESMWEDEKEDEVNG